MNTGALHIVKPGLLSTVQDLGRYGHQGSGVPVAGPMDIFSHRLANQLAGNEPDAATIEITLLGPELVVEADEPRILIVVGCACLSGRGVAEAELSRLGACAAR